MRPFLWSYNISICTDFNFSRYQVQLQIYIDKCDAKFLAVSALDGVFRWQSTQTIVPSKVIPLELSVYWCRAHADSHTIMRACRLCSLLSLILYKTKMRIRDLAIRLAGLMASCSWQSPHKCKKTNYKAKQTLQLFSNSFNNHNLGYCQWRQPRCPNTNFWDNLKIEGLESKII